MDNSPATVAIIIPCYNEQSYIARCLDSVLSNDCDFRLIQIVIVDGMSSDRIREIVKEYVPRHPFIQLIDNPKRLKADALNLGVTSTTSDVVMRMDAHATYAPFFCIAGAGILEQVYRAVASSPDAILLEAVSKP